MDVPEGVIVREEEPIGRHLPLRASSGAFERWVEVPDEASLAAAIRAARAEKMPVRVLHPFADALPPEGGISGVTLRLGASFEDIRPLADGTVDVGVAVPLARLALESGFSAWSRGGGTVGDALADGWIAPAVLRVRRFRGRSFEEVEGLPDEPKSLVVRAVLRRGVTVAPILAGTSFVEPGRRSLGLRGLLAKCGVSGVRLRDAALAEDDAAVLVNRGTATPRELRLLLAAVKDKVRVGTGFELTERLTTPGRGGRL